VVDAIDDRFSFRRERGQHQRRASPQIAGNHLRAGERGGAGDNRLPSFDTDVSAHTGEFEGVHEAVLENRFGDEGDPLGLSHQRHELRLEIGGETGVFFGGDVDAFEHAAPPYAELAGRGLGDLHAGLKKLRDQSAQVVGHAAGYQQIAARESAGNEKRPGFDPVGDHRVRSAAQGAHSFDVNHARSRAFDPRAHGDEQFG
jgi:hypothetical protein